MSLVSLMIWLHVLSCCSCYCQSIYTGTMTHIGCGTQVLTLSAVQLTPKAQTAPDETPQQVSTGPGPQKP
eukprot:m.35464 g.35464  ORF g.35464 m.35464 type:complete len:70 (+) comp9893_c0_seq3:406-615(+)